MKAVRIYKHGDPDKLIYDDIPEPNCESNKVKIEIKASAINHLDIWIRKGISDQETKFPIILGSDGSGCIVEVGDNVKNFNPGDDVVVQPGIWCGKCHHCDNGKENYCLEYGILGETENGTQAEYVILSPDNLHTMPAHLSYEEAASMSLVFMTSYEMIIDRAKLRSDETILIYGGASGVGSAAIQICRDIGATIITTVGNEYKKKYCENLGAHYVLNHNMENWFKKARDITKKKGVHVVFEHIGSATWKQSQYILSKGGRIVTCGATTGSDVDINLAHLFIKQQSILGSTMSNSSNYKEVMNKINNRKYTPMVDRVFAMKDIREAHKYIANRKQMGKIVVVP